MAMLPGASSEKKGSTGIAPLTDDEVQFCWKSVVEQSRISVESLQGFFQDVCGERLSGSQAQDMLSYMDANGDGYVGRDDFKHFMSVGSLAQTKPQNFMWTPNAKYREDLAVRKDPRNSPRMPEARSPWKRRPAVRGTLMMPRADPRREELPSRSKTPRERKGAIGLALEKYERESWTRLLKEEEDFQKQIFDLFVAEGREDLSVEDYHRLLSKWYPVASNTPGKLRAGDSLAALQALLRRERQEQTSSLPEGGDPVAEASQAPTLPDEQEPSVSRSLFVNVLQGKFQPDEHFRKS
mmetsp:Transcript_42997/g.93625  ORF Transcript_42997/g.93625 Transcript_42997/m.93625 type:complete len:296 (-) Transcript_42997:25-912(-)